MGPIEDPSALGFLSRGSRGSFVGYGLTNVYAVTEYESYSVALLYSSGSGYYGGSGNFYDPLGAVITITRTNGATGRMAVSYTTRDGTAIAGLDYVATNGVIIFDDFQMSTNIVVPILYNFSSTNNTTFEVVITNAVADTNVFSDIAGNTFVESQALQPTFNSAPMTVLIYDLD